MIARAKKDLSNLREHRRYPAWLDAHLLNRSAGTAAPVTVVDISPGGALLLGPAAVEPGCDIALTVVANDGPLEIDGHVIRSTETWLGSEVHIGFEIVVPATRTRLHRLVRALESEFDDGLRTLAGRHH